MTKNTIQTFIYSHCRFWENALKDWRPRSEILLPFFSPFTLPTLN